MPWVSARLRGTLAMLAFVWVAAMAADAAAEPPLRGATYDFEYDARDVGAPERAWSGRAFVHERVAATPERPAPLVVFLHGTNEGLIKYRFMGSGFEEDLRTIVSELIDGGRVEPFIVAAPSSIMPEAINLSLFAWPGFDLDRFVALTAERLRGVASIDRRRVVVVGHSGAGCNMRGGLAAALEAKVPPYAALSVDTCMGTDLAQALVRAAPSTRVYVTWQVLGWRSRTFDWFVTVFQQTLAETALPEGTVRVLDLMEPVRPHPHDAMVRDSLEKYLPLLFPRPSESTSAPERNRVVSITPRT